MANERSGYVFLTECADFSEARVVKSFLESQGFNPKVRDEQTRGVAPHFGEALGQLIIEIPEREFIAASLALEEAEKTRLEVVTDEPTAEAVENYSMSKKVLWNAILGLTILPLVCTFYSVALSFRLVGHEFPLSKISRRRLLWAIFINSVAFYFWLTIAPKYFFQR